MTTESRLGALEGTTAEHAALRAEIRAVRTETRERLAAVRTEIRDVRAEVAALRTAALRAEIRADFAALRTEMRAEMRAIGARLDRITLALVGGSIAFTLTQIGVIITIILRT